MVYLSLSVDSVEEAMDFYLNKVGLFHSIGSSRLVCDSGANLIIDLYCANSEEHEQAFGQREHVRSAFWIKPEGKTLSILDRLRSNGVSFSERKDLGGHHLSLIDPSGNRFGIAGDLGDIR